MNELFFLAVSEVFCAYYSAVITNLIIITPIKVLGFSIKNSVIRTVLQK